MNTKISQLYALMVLTALPGVLFFRGLEIIGVIAMVLALSSYYFLPLLKEYKSLFYISIFMLILGIVLYFVEGQNKEAVWPILVWGLFGFALYTPFSRRFSKGDE